MPRDYEMTWEHKRRRWAKMYKGKRYTVTPSVLSEKFAVQVPETQDGSYQFANAWWKEKKVEIDSADRPVVRPLLPMEDLAAASLGYQGPLRSEDAALLVRLALGADNFSETDKEEITAQARTDGTTAAAVNILAGLLARRLVQGNLLADADNEMVKLLPPARIHQVQDGIAALRGEPTASTDRMVETHAEAWLKFQKARVDAGQMTAARCANNRTCLEQLKTFLGPQADVEGINAAKLEGFYQHCLAKIAASKKQVEDGWSVSYARDVFSVAKAFIRWLVERGTIDPPRNLASKSFKFGSPAKAVQTWTPDEFHAAIEAAPGKLKLALLLMANTGATQEDVSDLKDAEVDWQAGRIIRKRSKTAACENVPVVNYRLWPLTFELLKKYRSGGERVLLTEEGQPYVRCQLREDGKLSKADGFASNYVHLKKKLRRTMPSFDRPLKQLRKLGATLLGNHPDYGRFQSYFLGHSPRTVADRSYVVPSKEMFDQAVTWLGTQLGQVPVEDEPAEPARQTKGRKKQAT